jgi:hypothetical protein
MMNIPSVIIQKSGEKEESGALSGGWAGTLGGKGGYRLAILYAFE